MGKAKGKKPIGPMAAVALWATGADDGKTGRSKARGAEVCMEEVVAAIAEALPKAKPAERARLRHRLGYIAYLVGDVRTKAKEAFTMMRDDAKAAKSKGLEALALCGLSFVHDFIGERHEALRLAKEASALAMKAGDKRTLALALNAEAQYLKENGENAKANSAFRHMEDIGREIGDDRLIMAAKIGLGRTTKMSDAPRAIQYYNEAIDFAKSMGDAAALAVCYNNLADWMIYTDSVRESIQLREQCKKVAEKHGLRPYVGRALIGMAKAYTILGETDKARELLDRGYPKVLSVGDLEGDLHSSLNLAYLYLEGGDVPRAAQLYRDTLERSLKAPDHACAVFAEEALELIAEGRIPKPGILPGSDAEEKRPRKASKTGKKVGIRDLDVGKAARDASQGGLGSVGGLRYAYPTGDLLYTGSPTQFSL